MTSNPIADRYASALFETVERGGRLEEVLRQLLTLRDMLGDHEELRQFLFNPDIEVEDKLGVLDRLLGQAWSDDLRALLHVVLSMGRVEALEDIAEAFRDLVDAAQGRVRVVVRSARPLPASLKTAVASRIRQLAQREPELTEETDPGLIGGIQVFMDRRLFDGSLKTRLHELRQQLKRVKVH